MNCNTTHYRANSSSVPGDPTFVSNASVSNALAHKLIAKLRLESVDFFHYQVKDAIPIGENWLGELERQLEQASIFIALLTEEFVHSRWCQYELQVAQKRAAEQAMRIHVYLLEPGLMQSLMLLGLADTQVLDVNGREHDDIAATIVADIDRELLKPQRAQPAPGQPAGQPTQAQPTAAPPAASVVALILEDDERLELIEILSARLQAEDDRSRSTWVRELLMHARLFSRLAGEDYTGNTRTIANRVVDKTEGLGVLPNRKLAMHCLVDALREPDRVSNAAQPFLTKLAGRLAQLPVAP